MALGDPLEHLLAIDHAAAPAEQARGDIGHEDLVFGEVPFPDAATRGLHRQAETPFGVGVGHVGLDPTARFQQQAPRQAA